jgi:hypothetical protein
MIGRSFLAMGAAFLAQSMAFGFEGLVVSELPLGGDVTVPSEYPVKVPPKVEVVFSGVMNPQSMTLVNDNGSESVVKVFAGREADGRLIKLRPGSSAVYSFKSSKPVRVRVVSGDVRVSSIHPLKVQR